MKEATELKWLRWFYCAADFGPADDDVRGMLMHEFEEKTNTKVPKEYREGV